MEEDGGGCGESEDPDNGTSGFSIYYSMRDSIVTSILLTPMPSYSYLLTDYN